MPGLGGGLGGGGVQMGQSRLHTHAPLMHKILRLTADSHWQIHIVGIGSKSLIIIIIINLTIMNILLHN
jgi:hypothetical protein